MNEEDSVVRGTAISRKSLFELIILVIVLSFGINVLAGLMLTWLQAQVPFVLIIGCLLCVIPIVYVVVGIILRRKKHISVAAFIAYNPIQQTIVPVSRYEFSEKICDYIQSAFAENTALKTRWEHQPLEPYQVLVPTADGSNKKVDHKTLSKMRMAIDGTNAMVAPEDCMVSLHFYRISVNENATVKFITEAMEYYMLEMLSAQLHGHFNNEQFADDNQLTVYERGDIPAILLSNTFLELFSRPMVERPAFVQYALERPETDDESMERYLFAAGGAKYRLFRLILPQGSTITRPAESVIEIKTKKVTIRFATRFEGNLAAIPFAFRNFYMGNTNLLDLATYAARIDISVSVNLLALLSGTGRLYYQWVDSFLDAVEKSASQEAFLKQINWENTLTLLTCLEHTAMKSHEQQGNGSKDKKLP